MAFVPVPNSTEVAVIGEVEGQECVNTFGVTHSASELTTAEQDALCNQFAQWVNDELCPILSNTYTLLRVVSRSLASSSSPVGSFVPGLPITGILATGTPLPNNDTIAVSFRTGRAGRSFRGRNYFPTLRTTQLNGTNTIATGLGLDVLTAYSTLNTYIRNGVADAFHSVLSRYANNAPRIVGLATAVTDYLLADLTLDSQRRRLPKRGV